MLVNTIEKLEKMMRSPQRITLQALESAYAIWAKRYPQWEAAFFDSHFLHTHVIPHFSAGEFPTAETLAEAWVAQMGAINEQATALVTELTPVAADFLYVVKSERCFFEEKAERRWHVLHTVMNLLSGKVPARRMGSLS